MDMMKSQPFFNAYAFPGCVIVLRDKHLKTLQTEKVFEKYGIMKRRIWVRKVKNANRHYLETGLCGGYDTAGIVDSELDGKPVVLFEDTALRRQRFYPVHESVQ